MVEQVGGEEGRNPPGWNWPSPGILTQMRAPFTSWPTNGSIGASSSTKPTTIDT